ncbi:MAG: metallophosphoesterase family protein [Lachnospiraceae bacterium]|nr:metallophosphoesterase family protein [Lachnospiraceae bacterium]
MKKIVILADTHGLLREEVKEELRKADLIFHAGDINTQKIVDELKGYARLVVVRGNNDKEWAEGMPKDVFVEEEGIRFYMVHNKKEIPKDLNGVDVVIYGHSHKYEAEEKEGILWLNPGSCGKRRFHQEITYCVMEADQGRYEIRKILIPQEG